MNEKPTYSIDYALRRVRDGIEYAEMVGDFQQLRKAVNDLEDAINADINDKDSKDQEDTNRSIISSFLPF